MGPGQPGRLLTIPLRQHAGACRKRHPARFRYHPKSTAEPRRGCPGAGFGWGQMLSRRSTSVATATAASTADGPIPEKSLTRT